MKPPTVSWPWSSHCTFISHMVQMKRENLCYCILKPWDLYPTWFRWNFSFLKVFIFYSFIYIPHGSDETYQGKSPLLGCLRIYIPHGSDETKPSNFKFDLLNTIYIPHGSDETWFCKRLYDKNFFIYIPHGSDETKICCFCRYQKLLFISHMVQMKQIKFACLMYVMKNLYLTWFRWNFKNVSEKIHSAKIYIPHGSDETSSFFHQLDIVQTYLYPTWFRWNLAADRKRWITQKSIYIPHGSDETLINYSSWKIPFLFISHMVQMKQTTIRTNISLFWHLYPTWFRWNSVQSVTAGMV